MKLIYDWEMRFLGAKTASRRQVEMPRVVAQYEQENDLRARRSSRAEPQAAHQSFRSCNIAMSIWPGPGQSGS